MKIFIFINLVFLSQNSFCQARYIHILVALCDNKNQGIVKVPEKIGNGQDPANNLYWGCAYGVKTFIQKQADWKLIGKIKNPDPVILERLIFKHRDSLVYMIADAYDGSMIKQTVQDFLNYSAGFNKTEIEVDSVKIKAGGNADLLCYVGHNGLMDFTLNSCPSKSDNYKRAVIILACASRGYFENCIQTAGAIPVLWTTHLLSPEAYTLDAAIDAWIMHESPGTIREKAAQAYNQYQQCGIRGARNLFATGFVNQ